MDNILKNLEKCSRFPRCSINICPLDPEAILRNHLPEENACPFTIKKRSKEQKGTRLSAPDNVLKVIPGSNKKMLNRRNLKRWHNLH
jgi:hypothetical protein